MKLGKYIIGIGLLIGCVIAYFFIPHDIRTYTDVFGIFFVGAIFSIIALYLGISVLNDFGLLKIKSLSDNQTDEIKKITHDMAVEMKSDIIQEVLQELKTKNADVLG
ncbi:MAG: hypothetical protein ATN34_04275 [Epulopiscium sp. Nele67-Bin002]|nr:MAG: hypothetical protein ATN34_04275 [Epulopiscium sp. Nele67-Bin002]OON91894.1 MAG: hypothetical protein ATN33_08385 [Epulopiscium sp. Nele67-Bin001]